MHSDSEDEVEKPRRRQKNVKPKLKKDEVLAEVLTFLCRKKGLCTSWDELSSHLCISTEKLKEIVFGFNLVKANGRTVKLDTDLNLCQEFIENPTGCLRSDCKSLHICPEFIHSTCDSADECDLGHSFTTRHNDEVLQEYEIQSLPTRLLLRLMSRLCDEYKNPRQLPDFCGDYNGQNGCSAGDRACSKLHVCEKFILNDGNTVCDGSCNLNHKTLKANVKRLLDAAGVDTNLSEKELLGEFKKHLQRKFGKMGIQNGKATNSVTSNNPAALSNSGNSSNGLMQAGNANSSAPVKADDDGNVTKPEVCLDCLNRKCTGQCGALHCKRNYQWQVKSDMSANVQWLNFCPDHNNVLEKAFCDPRLTSRDICVMTPARVKGNFWTIYFVLGFNGPSPPTWTADFEKMILRDGGNARQLEIRRLGTPSSVVSKDRHATTWNWYFLDNHNKWIEYGTTNSDKRAKFRSDVTSMDIERAYCAHLNGNGIPAVPFKTEGYDYEIQFTRIPIVQKNMSPQYSTEREVRRRPKGNSFPYLRFSALCCFVLIISIVLLLLCNSGFQKIVARNLKTLVSSCVLLSVAIFVAIS